MPIDYIDKRFERLINIFPTNAFIKRIFDKKVAIVERILHGSNYKRHDTCQQKINN